MTARRAITLVAWREIHERLHSRVFLLSTVLMLAVVGVSSVLSTALQSEKTYRIAVVAPAPARLDAALQRAAEPFDATVKLQVLRSAASGREQLREEKTDAVLLLSRDEIAFRGDVDVQVAAIADTAVRALRRHLPPAPELAAVTIERPTSKTSDAESVAATLGAALLLATLALYGQWVLTGVVEEKANRVVELVLSTVRPRYLLAGKVIGIGLLGLMQVALVGGLAASLVAFGVFDAPSSLGRSIALVVPWFALGFGLYAVAYAAAGSLASRAQDANSAGLPVTYTLIAVYFLGYVVLSANADSTLANVLTVFPLSAPLVLPARSALVGVPIWEHVLAVALVGATIYALIRFAGRIYGEGLLRSGARLNLRAALRTARHS
jgi:ABC-2 type transport system permease protein